MARVIAFNGSPHRHGNTHRLLRHILDEIERAGIGTEIIQTGGENIHPCTVCGVCLETLNR
jgi:multimeric flavodoxin WrbA